MKIHRWAAIVYLLTLAYLVFGIRIYPVDYIQISLGYNLIPFRKFSDLLSTYQDARLLANIDFWGNILLFIPFPYCLDILFRIRRKWKILLIGFITSACIELLQYLFHIGFADINDIITNTLGVLSGILLLDVLFPVYRRRFP